MHNTKILMMEKGEAKSRLLPMNELELPIHDSGKKRREVCATVTVNAVLCTISCLAALTCIIYGSCLLKEINNAKGSVDREMETVLKIIKIDKPETASHGRPQAVRSEPFRNSPLETQSHNTTEDRSEKNVNVQDGTPEEQNAHAGDFQFDVNENTAYIEENIDTSSGDDIPQYDSDEYNSNEGYSEYDDDYNEWNSGQLSGEQSDFDVNNNRVEPRQQYDDYDYVDGSGEESLDDEDTNTERRRRSVPTALERKTKQKGGKKRSRKPCKGKGCRKENRNKRQFTPLATQFDATISDKFISENLPSYDSNRITDGCKPIDELGGVLCRNKLFTPDDPGASLKIFKSPSWTSGKKALKQVEKSSVFQVINGGVLLIFAQVSFSSDRPTNGVSIVQSRKSDGQYPLQKIVQELQCKQGIPDPDAFTEKTNQSCSVIGLLMTKKGDEIEIYSNYKGSTLDLSTGSTYFGAVQLTKG